jgi:tRNA-specific 2-thiouridylase
MKCKADGHKSAMVAMSGGVDSSLTAALLLERGFRVTGATMHLWSEEQGGVLGASSCCSQGAAERARYVCHKLGIPHLVFNLTREFREHVVNAFLQTYARSHTPNPCIACNRHIKFRILLQRALGLGFDRLATGHYARVLRRTENGHTSYHLLRGVDPSKDQSYVLYMVGQKELSRLLLPLGELSKTEVRQEAARRGLPTATQPESQEICFIPDDDYRRFLATHLPRAPQPGPIRDLEGKVLGQHQGLPFYTIGQRKGLGISGMRYPLHVIAMDPTENALVVGPAEALLRSTLEAEEVTFVSGERPAHPLRVEAKIRYRATAAASRLVPLEKGRIRLEFDEPQAAITPGQAVVFYRGEEVLGGGTIRKPKGSD